MAYILKNTAAQINVKFTDAGRKKISEGQLNISLFQVGDSEVCYSCYESMTDDKFLGLNILRPKDNAQNTGLPFETNKMHVKYPIPIDTHYTANTYGPVLPAPVVEEIFNLASPRGFFTASTTPFTANTTSTHMLGLWETSVSGLTGGTMFVLNTGTCTSQYYAPLSGDIITVKFSNPYQNQHSCSTIEDTVIGCTPYLTYRVITGGTSATTASTLVVYVDRDIPDFSFFSGTSSSILKCWVYVYPQGDMLNYYGYDTPIPYWDPGSLSFDSNCDLSNKDVAVWNMNIPWTETVAGTPSSGYELKEEYGSTGYCGTKEYLGYQTSTGTIDSNPDGTFIYDSFGILKKIIAEDQKCISIIHYTNETISNFYGEKFGMKYEGDTVNDIGAAKNFKIHLPTLMWHKKIAAGSNTSGSGTGTGIGDETKIGQTFYADVLNPFTQNYGEFLNKETLGSVVNEDMNDPGIRYFNLYDDNFRSADSKPSRVGRVFPDLQIITIDDEELSAAMSYKSNRNWTLPMPSVKLIPAGTNCDGPISISGLFDNTNDTLWITYLLESNSGYTTGLHCNYYVKVDNSPNDPCAVNYAVDASIQFGTEFPYLRPYTLSGGTGFQADKLYILAQLTNGVRPDPSQWKLIDVTSQIQGHTVGTPINASGLTNSCSTFYVTAANYGTASTYNLSTYINIPVAGDDTNLQFGDEYYLYGNLETSIMATIYEMQYQVSLASNQYGSQSTLNSSLNPTYVLDSNNQYPDVRITEIGLFDQDKELMAIGKLRSPVDRGSGLLNFLVKIDF